MSAPMFKTTRTTPPPSWFDIALGEYNALREADKPNHTHAALVLLAIWPSYDNHDLQSCMLDVLSDLRHLCDLMGWDFAEVDSHAHRQYQRQISEMGPASHAALKSAIERDLC